MFVKISTEIDEEKKITLCRSIHGRVKESAEVLVASGLAFNALTVLSAGLIASILSPVHTAHLMHIEHFHTAGTFTNAYPMQIGCNPALGGGLNQFDARNLALNLINYMSVH